MTCGISNFCESEAFACMHYEPPRINNQMTEKYNLDRERFRLECLCTLMSVFDASFIVMLEL